MILIYEYAFIATMWKYTAMDKYWKTADRVENKCWLRMVRFRCFSPIVFCYISWKAFIPALIGQRKYKEISLIAGKQGGP